MPAERGPGTDNPYIEWSPMPFRPPLVWPNGARVALCLVLSLERLEWIPPRGALVPPSAVPRNWGPYPQAFDPTPDVAHREYGNRVSVFRVMKVLDAFGMRACVAMDSFLAQSVPFLVRACAERKWEFLAHGLVFTRMVSEKMNELEERAVGVEGRFELVKLNIRRNP